MFCSKCGQENIDAAGFCLKCGVDLSRLTPGPAPDPTDTLDYSRTIHTGQVMKLMERGTWFNVLDPGFNLHLNETQIAETWVVVKPSEDGDVTAIEAYDADGTQIIQLFGKRKPGLPELEAWREIVAGLPRSGVLA